MTAKEKAIELVSKYQNGYSINGYYYNFCNDLQDSKQCALIAVDEILWEIIKYSDNSSKYVVKNSEYWQEVKQEIEKL
jgi:hypothetical protein